MAVNHLRTWCPLHTKPRRHEDGTAQSLSRWNTTSTNYYLLGVTRIPQITFTCQCKWSLQPPCFSFVDILQETYAQFWIHSESSSLEEYVLVSSVIVSIVHGCTVNIPSIQGEKQSREIPVHRSINMFAVYNKGGNMVRQLVSFILRQSCY